MRNVWACIFVFLAASFVVGIFMNAYFGIIFSFKQISLKLILEL
jgi:hypothetical protein